VILPPDGDMADYMHSLEKLKAYDFENIAPGHGAVMGHGNGCSSCCLPTGLGREDNPAVDAVLGAATLDRLTPAVTMMCLRSAFLGQLDMEAHLIKLARDGRVIDMRCLALNRAMTGG